MAETQRGLSWLPGGWEGGGRDQTWAAVATVGLGGGGRELRWVPGGWERAGETRRGLSWLPWGLEGVGET